jgi:hypothetical protein
MNCKETEKNIIFYIEHQLPPDKQKELEEHLAKCSKCNAKHQFIQKTLQALENEKKLDVNPFISTKIIAQTQTKNSKNIFSKILQPVFITSLVIFALFIGYFLANNLNTLQYQNIQTEYSQNTDSLMNYVNNNIAYEDYYFVNAQ